MCGLAAASCARATAPGGGLGGTDGTDGGGGPDGGDDAPTTPVPRANGDPCVAAASCTSGFCVEDVCCESACGEACHSCAVSGSPGVCLPAEVGTDPRDECPDEGVSSCGRDGQCDGSGACRRYPIGVVCHSQSCLGSTRTNASRCGPDGACRPTSGQPCDPFRCDQSGSDCLVRCNDSSDCLEGSFCAAGSCGLKPLGAPCGAGGECNSLICQQGACCNTPCTGTCQSCALPGAAGTCTDVPAGEDPLDQCADSGPTSCGTDGTCDGQGRCRSYSSATVCTAPTCSGATGTGQGRCDGAGTCMPGPPVTCGTCQVCTLSAAAATCAPVAAGGRPVVASQCVDQGAASCGGDGTCNGAGACRLYASGTTCVAGSCPSGATQVLPRSCNGAGTCLASTSVTCPGGFLCNPTMGVCKSTCTVATSAADCLAPNVCTGTICGTLKLQYTSMGAPGATTNGPHPWFLIVNLGPTAVALSDLTIRYWYTADGAVAQVAVVDFAANSATGQIPANNITSLFTPVARTGADTFLQLGFNAAAGTLAGNGGTTQVQSRFNSLNPDFGVTYVQTNDYSFDATKTAFADWTHVTLYRRGVLVWGIEP